jgi:acetyltransferase-like isoleucine patch superfamily enzyme
MKELIYQLRWALPLWLVGVLTNWWPDNRVAVRLRGSMARPFIGKCGQRFLLGRNVTILNANRMKIGNDVYIAQGCWLNAQGNMRIDDEVVMSPYVVISTMQHVFKDGSVRFGGSISGSVKISKGTWIASHATIKCGVSVGQGCVIAANAAVVTNVPDGSVAGGVPAKILGANRDAKASVFARNTEPSHKACE